MYMMGAPVTAQAGRLSTYNFGYVENDDGTLVEDRETARAFYKELKAPKGSTRYSAAQLR